MKLIDLLKEVGDTLSSEPKELSRSKYSAQYEFSTGKNNYRVMIFRDPDPENYGLNLLIIFGVLEDGEVDTSKNVNDSKNVFKVMTNVMSAVDQEIKKTEKETEMPVTSLTFEPTDSKRADVYILYVKKSYKHAQIRQTHNKTYVHVEI